VIFLYRRGDGLIFLTFLGAFVLTSVPLPEGIERFHPNWLALAVIYWCMMLPERVGIGIAWLVGLLLDTARGTLLGQQALGLALIAFLTLKLHRRLRVFPLWQQCPLVLLFLLVQQLAVSWVNGIIGYPPRDLWDLGPAVGGMLMWPWVYIVLRDLCQRWRVI
jgi:rod shape-determining protein MreD